MDDIAIRVHDITKVYKLYDKPTDRLKEALGFSRKKRYTEHYALNHVSFDVKRGETVGIIGTNGSGKSTILKIITGVLNQTSGTIDIDGRISALLELGAGFNQEYTGIENVYLNGTMIGYSKEEIDAKLDDILNFADIGDFVYQPVKTYSSGMFVRLAFAVAINIDPEILIVDEALSVGDVFFQAKCYHKFEEFKKEGKTILFVSHDLSSVSKYCDRVILLNKGVKLAEGSAKDMVNMYKKLLVNQLDLSSSAYEASKKSIETSDDMANMLDEKQQEGASGEAAGAEGQAAADGTQSNAAGTGEGAEPVSSGTGEAAGQGAAGEGARAAGTEGQEQGGSGEGQAEGVDSLLFRKGNWNSHFKINPNRTEYGTREAELIDFAVIDDQGNITGTIQKGSEFTIKTKILFHDTVQDPIFTYTFRSIRGTDITGTNTMYEKVDTGTAHEGDVYIASFKQMMSLQGGEYLLSVSCTGFRNGDFTVYHRLYDVINITVISDKNTVGYYDMFSDTSVEKIEKGQKGAQ